MFYYVCIIRIACMLSFQFLCMPQCQHVLHLCADDGQILLCEVKTPDRMCMLALAGMQGGMGQGPAGQVPVPLTPYGIELTKSVAAAGYFADRLRPEERQRSYLTLQQVEVVPASFGACKHWSIWQ